MDPNNVALAERSGLGHVRFCQCRAIHLSIGPATLTLTPEAFAQVALMIRQATESLSVIAAASELDPDSLQSLQPQQNRFTH